ncbi:hypothetical protein ACWF5S_08510 [Peribacillus butanolivorans]
MFKEITDLAPPLSGVPGYYIIVLDEYAQAYIGMSNNITKRIQSHWSKQKEFDRLIFGSKENSTLSIEALELMIKREYLSIQLLKGHEDNFINLFNNKYLLNRYIGGTLDGFKKAIFNRKTREI